MSDKEYVVLPKGDAQALMDIVKAIDARQKAAKAAEADKGKAT